MTQFHENIKTILTDVETFFTSLSGVSLPPAQQSEKARITSEISRLRSQFPQLGGSPTPAVDDEYYDDTAVESPKEAAEADVMYEETDPPPTPKTPTTPSDIYEDTDSPAIQGAGAATLKEMAKKSGFLKMKKEKKKLLGGGPKKVWCVVSADDVFYMFATQTSKKQMSAFALKGYEAQPQGDGNKKEFPFQLFSPGKPPHQFLASSKNEMVEWVDALNRISGFTSSHGAVSSEDDIPPLYAEPEELRPSHIAKQVSQTAAAAPADDDDDDDVNPTYDEAVVQPERLKESPPPPKARAAAQSTATSSTKRPPQPAPPGDDEFYDDTQAIGGKEQKEEEEPEDEEGELYDEGESIAPTPLRARPAASEPTANKPAAPLPTPPPPAPANEDSKDYSQMYYGLYDCDTENPDELPFLRGDIIQVINRDYDEYSWWVARLNGRVGIVPKQYLTKAYELVR